MTWEAYEITYESTGGVLENPEGEMISEMPEVERALEMERGLEEVRK